MATIKYYFLPPHNTVFELPDAITNIFHFRVTSEGLKKGPVDNHVQINVKIENIIWEREGWEVTYDNRIKVYYFLACEAIKHLPLEMHQKIILTSQDAPLQCPCDPAGIEFPYPPPFEVKI